MKTFFIKTYGCSLNQADSLIMEQVLIKSGFKKESFDKAEYIIINSCSVKTPTENKILSYIYNIPKDKKIIISGCLVHTNKNQLKKLFKCNLIGCDNIFEVIKSIKSNKDFISDNNIVKVNIESISKNEIIEIVPISKGCLGNCSYCATKFARGRLFSYSEKDILEHIKKAIKRGKKEFWITAEDTGCYGFDKADNIINLLNNIISLEGFFKLRLGMLNPLYAFRFRKELAILLNNSKMFKFIHIPVQSGSDKILELMNRGYKVNIFIKTINYLRKHVKDITISTDIIVGFPSETDDDFNKTYELIRLTKPDVINITRFWKRNNTKASLMKNQIKPISIKERIKKLLNLKKSFKKKKLKNMFALVDEKGLARSDNYRLIKTNKGLGSYFKI